MELFKTFKNYLKNFTLFSFSINVVYKFESTFFEFTYSYLNKIDYANE